MYLMMRKIDKSQILATTYKTWLDSLNEIHPEYASSSDKYYYDIVANLVWIQGGLCAYTEMILNDKSAVKPEKWKEGGFKKFEVKGALDHYFPNLKKTTGWDWNNFFLIDYDINTKIKGSKIPNGILKPDQENYDPFYFLQYNYDLHKFEANNNRDFDFQLRIKHDIDILGLNYGPIIYLRKVYLQQQFSDLITGHRDLNYIKNNLNQFYTAFEMSMRQLNLDNI
jgi:hypothetical protein